MSAYLCQDETFVAIAALVTPDTVWKTARILKMANYRSLEARYGDEIPEDIKITVAPGTIGKVKTLSGQRLMGICQGYQYQSGEYKQWKNSYARKLSQGLYEAIKGAAGFTDEQAEGWTLGASELEG
jgi:hypothetical protein